MSAPIWQYQFQTLGGRRKSLRVICGDLCAAGESYDIAVCSAFKGDYVPVPRTLIGALYTQKGISVAQLAQNPELDLRSMGCWLSRELDGDFRRLACVELIDRQYAWDAQRRDSILLKSAFSTLRFLLEQASVHAIPVRSIALPVLGSGNQGIELYYIAAPLVSQCLQALQTIDELEQITFYDRSPDKAQELAQVLEKAVQPESRALPQVFVSYSSVQSDIAQQIRAALLKQGIPCWMAPNSIPPGSSYQEEIATALSQVKLLALLLTPEAERSRWVQKEVGVAIGSGCLLLPCQLCDYPIGPQFRFLLDGEQILPAWQIPVDRLPALLSEQVERRLKQVK